MTDENRGLMLQGMFLGIVGLVAIWCIIYYGNVAGLLYEAFPKF